MIDHLDSDYDCALAGSDLHALKEEQRLLQSKSTHSQAEQEQLNHVGNQIRFIENKCSIHRS
ncbi:DUF2524 domain-containing protein [Paenibacillus athensensis]|uniref:DUF2524 domain-containing protein n=1 Tax=Paenibacillus athensensis TaxID=1967502 RepID=A0A4Y8Q9F0_9BACL|nr:DUF2524 domain-containing protein [Paenibacillus athensensis]MCD1259010.1 DUF2524 domain-containing protein [Paenibacillus athensensis]